MRVVLVDVFGTLCVPGVAERLKAEPGLVVVWSSSGSFAAVGAHDEYLAGVPALFGDKGSSLGEIKKFLNSVSADRVVMVDDRVLGLGKLLDGFCEDIEFDLFFPADYAEGIEP